MSTERIPLDDKALWQSLATDRPVAPAAVSEMDFAGWLDGQLSEPEAARIDAAVAADPALRQAALELADILGKPLPAAPSRMAARAQALVGGSAGRPAGKSWLASLLPDFGSGFAFQRGALVASAVMVAAVGFMLGDGLSQRYDEAVYASTTQPTNGTAVRPFGRDTTGELNDLFTDAT
jgi:anti-sigma factor RsiW